MVLLLCICNENLSNKSKKYKNIQRERDVYCILHTLHTEIQKVEMKRQSNFVRLNYNKVSFPSLLCSEAVNLSNFFFSLIFTNVSFTHFEIFYANPRFKCTYQKVIAHIHLKRAQVQHKHTIFYRLLACLCLSNYIVFFCSSFHWIRLLILWVWVLSMCLQLFIRVVNSFEWNVTQRNKLDRALKGKMIFPNLNKMAIKNWSIELSIVCIFCYFELDDSAKIMPIIGVALWVFM